MAPPGTLGQFHALLGSPSGTGLSAAEPAWVTGSVDLLLRFSDELQSGQRLSLKLAACGRVGSVLVAGICFFLHICFNLIFESGMGKESLVGCIGPKPVVGTESCQHGKKRLHQDPKLLMSLDRSASSYAEPLHSQPSRRWDGEVTLACSLLLFLL